jgi:membrane-bound lytic murein transglycosylase D
LGKIARKFGVSVASIKRWNHLRSSRIREGQRLTIYPRKYNFTKSTPPKKNTTVVKQKKPLPKGKVVTHIVQPGDSLWTISRQYPGVSVENLREWNGIWGNKLHPGTTIKLVLPEHTKP